MAIADASSVKQLDPKFRQLIPLSDWQKYFAWPTVNGLRGIVKHRHTNGLDKYGAVLRSGRRILIDRDRFFGWVDAQNGIDTEA